MSDVLGAEDRALNKAKITALEMREGDSGNKQSK